MVGSSSKPASPDMAGMADVVEVEVEVVDVDVEVDVADVPWSSDFEGTGAAKIISNDSSRFRRSLGFLCFLNIAVQDFLICCALSPTVAS